MALKIAKNSGLTDIVSTDQTNPITTTHPIAGGSQELKLYLYNDNSAKKYTGITIDPMDTTATDESTYIQLAPDNAGVAGTYGAGGAVLSMADISDSAVGHAFWIKVTTPSVADSQNKTDIFLRVAGTEYAV